MSDKLNDYYIPNRAPHRGSARFLWHSHSCHLCEWKIVGNNIRQRVSKNHIVRIILTHCRLCGQVCWFLTWSRHWSRQIAVRSRLTVCWNEYEHIRIYALGQIRQIDAEKHLLTFPSAVHQQLSVYANSSPSDGIKKTKPTKKRWPPTWSDAKSNWNVYQMVES